jgi:hypothetical protein
VVGTKETRLPGIKFNGCTSSGCEVHTMGDGSGEVVTTELIGHLRFAVGGKAKKLLDNELVPTSGELFMQYELCGLNFEYRPEATGGVLAPVIADKMLAVSSNKYTLVKGEQKPSEYEDLEGKLVAAGLEQNFAGGPFEEAGWGLTSEQTNEEAIEANAVV